MADGDNTKKARFAPPELDEESRARLEEEHEDILVLRGGEKAPWTIVLCRPNRQQTIAFKQHARKDPSTANEALLRRIVVFPKGEDLEKVFARWPLVPDFIADSAAFKGFLGGAVDDDKKS